MVPAQSRAARALLGWSIDKLQEKSAALDGGVGRMTIVRFERGDTIRDDRVRIIRQTLENAGIVFIGDGEVSRAGGEGVRYEKPIGD